MNLIRRLVAILLFVLFSFHHYAFAQLQCAQIFSAKNSPKFLIKSHVTNGDDVQVMTARVFSEVDEVKAWNLTSQAQMKYGYESVVGFWGEKIPANPQKMYRGMGFTDLRDLLHILENGFDTSKTYFNKVFLDYSPSVALQYAFTPNHSRFSENGLRVLFEVDRKLTPTKKSGYGHRTANTVSAEAIGKVYVFSKDGSIALPFDSFSRESLVAQIRKKLR